MYNKLPALRAEIAALPLLRIYDPVVGPADIDPTTGPLPIRFTARLSSASAWQVAVEDADGAPVAQWTGSGTAVDATWTDPRADVPGRPALAHRGGHRPRRRPGRSTTSPRRRRSTSPRCAHRQRGQRQRHRRVLADGFRAHLGGGHRRHRQAGEGARRRQRRSRGAQQLTWSGPSGHYRAVLRMARAAGVATVTLPFDIRRGVVSVTLTPAVVNARGPARVALRAAAHRGGRRPDPAGRLDAHHRRRPARQDRRQLLDGRSPRGAAAAARLRRHRGRHAGRHPQPARRPHGTACDPAQLPPGRPARHAVGARHGRRRRHAPHVRPGPLRAPRPHAADAARDRRRGQRPARRPPVASEDSGDARPAANDHRRALRLAGHRPGRPDRAAASASCRAYLRHTGAAGPRARHLGRPGLVPRRAALPAGRRGPPRRRRAGDLLRRPPAVHGAGQRGRRAAGAAVHPPRPRDDLQHPPRRRGIRRPSTTTRSARRCPTSSRATSRRGRG